MQHMHATREALMIQKTLPEPILAALEADADALADLPNLWVQRKVVEGAEPALTVAEQAVQQLYRSLVGLQLAPPPGSWQGVEYWCQVYEGGRGLGFHFDKDEQAMAADGRMVNPTLSSVLYLTGSQEDSPRQAPTVLIDQCYCHETRCVLPEHPAWSSLVFPLRNQYLLFGGGQAHGVLEAMPAAPALQRQQGQEQGQEQEREQPGPKQRLEHDQERRQQDNREQQREGQQQQQQPQLQHDEQKQQPQQQRRVTFLVNWWPHQPDGVLRATAEDVSAGRLAAACGELVSTCDMGAASGDAGAASGALAALSLEEGRRQQAQQEQQQAQQQQAQQAQQGAQQQQAQQEQQQAQQQQAQQQQQMQQRPRRVPFVAVDALPLQAGDVLPVDDLLQERMVCINGSGIGVGAAAHAVTITHPGLTLVPLDQDAGFGAGFRTQPSVLAALVPTADLACDSNTDSDQSSVSGSSVGEQEEEEAQGQRQPQRALLS
ncbi:hypothetical protein D9Q98_007142 [Chlorella vulgaris]|uniref:Uncharacterized protein n=1 Tax=Chlorella vulgaris TaxID=3077 RepID=A0A9D4YUZ9_CHLVU|nr:hypothetical protein D9Q98_007142 [Chlorella vulgaris]